MSEHALAQQQMTNTPQEAARDSLSLQHRYGNRAEPTVLHERFFDEACRTFAEPRFGYDFSRVPAHTDMMRWAQPLLRTGTMVQRYSVNGNAESATCATCSDEGSTPVSATAEPTAEPASPAPEATATTEPEEESAGPEETTASVLLVEDSAAELAPGQMRKSEFLAQLRAAVTSTAESAMAGTGRTTADCPYLDYWFGYYSAQDVQHVERALRRYAPEASSATTAREYIPIIAARVRRSVETWVRTGEVTGVPEGLPGMGLLGSLGRLVSGIGSIFFKARNGGARKPNDPRAIRSQLGSGQPLNSGVRSRMESAFGMDFSHVRTHTDTNAAGLSDRLNARAFTVGKHVAFGSGEYRPGTLFGDALIAHEMAHVVQQSGASDSVAPMQTGNPGYNRLEEDADQSAVGALASLWSKSKGMLTEVSKSGVPRLKSGLRLQRCVTTSPGTRRAVAPAVPVNLTQKPSAPCDVAQRGINPCCTATMLAEIGGKVGEAIPKVRNAISRLSSSPEGVRSQLFDNFRMRPDDSRIPLVLGQFQSMLAEMEGNDVIFMCNDFADRICGGRYTGRSSNCQSSRPRYIQICADYFWHVDNPSSKYLSTRSPINWVKTMIHEYAHVGCVTPPGILGEGDEFYKGRGTYPPENPDIAIKNADSYAWFAMEVG